MIQVLQELSRPGGAINEDRIWHTPNIVAVLDGATSLQPAILDGRWFAEQLVLELEASTCPTLPEKVNTAVERVCRAFQSTAFSDSSDYYPSAAGIFVQERGPNVEILAIGDCTGAFSLKNGNIVTVRDDSVKRLDQEVLARCAALRARMGKSIAQLVRSEEIQKQLLENRKKMNQPQGYRIMSFGMPPCTEKDLLCIPAEQIRRFALWSDGFDTAQDRLLAPGVSLEELYARIRRDEADDPDFEIRPRFKCGDDASAIVAEIALES